MKRIYENCTFNHLQDFFNCYNNIKLLSEQIERFVALLIAPMHLRFIAQYMHINIAIFLFIYKFNISKT
jgi:hypothetical protein